MKTQPAEAIVGAKTKRPIAVDLDGTLLHSDTLHEGLIRLLVLRPWMLLGLIAKLFAGKAAFKRHVAGLIALEVDTIPEHRELLAYLEGEKRRGRKLGLFSAADQTIVSAFAERFGIFDFALGSDGRRNLSGAAKLAAIREALGADFVYAGDGKVDLPIWRASSGAIVVGRTRRLLSRLGSEIPVERAFISTQSRLRLWLAALRIHQWAKNVLVFVPAILSLPMLTVPNLVNFALAFVTLGTIASATYLVNDLADLPSDRRHHSKRNRPIAACAIPLSQAVASILLLAAVAAGLIQLLPRDFLIPVGLYLATTLGYSLGIKRVAVLDVLCLAFLFTLRIAAGAALIPQPPPYWLFAFSMFFFTSLAFVKRYTELLSLGGERQEAHGRGYQQRDLPVVLGAGLATGMSALVIFLIYLGDEHFDRALFKQPVWLGAAGAIIAYWLLRVWLLAVRDEMHDDPVLFALRDRASIIMGFLVGVALFLAW